MISLIDTTETEVVPGNLDQLQKELSEAVQQASPTDEAPVEQETPAKKVRVIEVNDEELPENLRGKDVKDIVRMYQESQSTIGRMANDLGTQRKLTDRLLDLKRAEDLQQNGAPASPKVQVSGTELLDNPTEAIERVVQARLQEQAKKTQAEIDALHAQRAAEQFMTRHPDVETVGKDPGFTQFVQGSPYRQRLAQQAASGDWGAADELMTEFKDRRQARAPAKEDTVEDVKNKNLEAAAKAALEGGASANKVSSGSKKIWTRIELLELQMKRPEVYYDEATQAVILQAYRENRVK